MKLLVLIVIVRSPMLMITTRQLLIYLTI